MLALTSDDTRRNSLFDSQPDRYWLFSWANRLVSFIVHILENLRDVAASFLPPSDPPKVEAMIIPREQYVAWQMRCDVFHEIISEENAEWVPALVGFTNEIESECPDSDVVGYARTARRQAIAFSDTRSRDRTYTFNGFLASLFRLSVALGMHLIGHRAGRDADGTKP